MLKLNFDFKKENVVLAGVSGGADSVALLNLLKNEAKKVGFKLICIHVNHHLRGKSSQKDAEFVQKICKNWQIQCVIYDVDCKKGKSEQKVSLEETARNLRYDCFYQAFEKFNADYLFLAHHLNDNVETILLNLIRGTGAMGAIGIKNSEKIIRPFLKNSKEEILDYTKLNNLTYREDKSNFDIKFNRNYLRKVIIPKIEKINPNFKQNITRFAENLMEDEKYFNAILPIKLIKIDQKNQKINILLELFNNHNAIIIRTIRKALNNFGWSKDLFKVNFIDIIKLSSLNNGAKIYLPHNLIATKNYEFITITKNNADNNKVINIAFRLGETKIEKTQINITKLNDKDYKNCDFKADLNVKYADFDKLSGDLVFRHRKKGDKFEKFGGGTLTLSDYLIDKKIPQNERDELIVLAKDNEIYWIVGLEISNKLKITTKTKEIVKLENKNID